MNAWFEVDKEGLAKLLKRRGMQYVLFELLQNGWDTGATRVDVKLTPVEGRPLVDISVVDDDPDGFRDLRHAYTLFAESEKKGDPSKRGRFNLGEKLVLAACDEARITSTKGALIFQSGGARSSGRTKREYGTEFQATIRMTRDELAEVLEAARTVIAPIPTTVNDAQLEPRQPLRTFQTTLPTEVADGEGYLRRSARITEVRVYARLPGQPSRLYELGIPVVETDDPWDVEIMQKVPLSAERDNVTPAYLRDVRVAVLNAMHDQLSADDASRTAVIDALADENVSEEAVKAVLTQQYGEKRAAYDPSDPEANNRLVAAGYKIIHGGAFPAEVWENIRRYGGAPPGGTISPTPKPYSSDPNAPLRKLLPEADWTSGMRNLAAYAKEIATHLIDRSITVTIDKGHISATWGACYGSGELTFNLAKCGYAFFDEGPSERVNALLIHEFAHDKADNHLDERFFRALQRLGARLTALALKDPELFRRYGWKETA